MDSSDTELGAVGGLPAVTSASATSDGPTTMTPPAITTASGPPGISTSGEGIVVGQEGRERGNRVPVDDSRTAWDTGTKAKKSKKVYPIPPPYCHGRRLHDRELGKYCHKRKIGASTTSGLSRMFIQQLDIITAQESPPRELIVCRLLRESPMSINQALCNHGLESWIIRPEEECTLAKISILYQLANGCLEYTT